MVEFHIITIFPNIFDSYINESLIKRALKNKIIKIKIHNLRDYADNKHKKVDDKPFGGGPGMVLGVKPIFNAVRKITNFKTVKGPKKTSPKKERIILLSARGKKLDQKSVKRLSKYKKIILICGRYEGVDERVGKYIADEKISIGDYILSGGELPALVLIESISRFVPGFLGKQESLEEIKGSYPVYTRPDVFSPKKGVKWTVPKVLLSGNHKKIDEWRKRINS